ncbi:hypothetical protein E2C01_006981 [Portunus trituberculatus]|uniref:Uncharacterized protein n=1 Tax=Portunus trituberculatus TaxID=210409 RepID=A0A5B7CZ95_PORTR|nr:hypothetical protein [Portunus trituberculatus]
MAQLQSDEQDFTKLNPRYFDALRSVFPKGALRGCICVARESTPALPLRLQGHFSPSRDPHECRPQLLLFLFLALLPSSIEKVVARYTISQGPSKADGFRAALHATSALCEAATA